MQKYIKKMEQEYIWTTNSLEMYWKIIESATAFFCYEQNS